MFVCLVDVAGHVFHGTDMIRVLGKFPADFQTFFFTEKADFKYWNWKDNRNYLELRPY